MFGRCTVNTSNDCDSFLKKRRNKKSKFSSREFSFYPPPPPSFPPSDKTLILLTFVFLDLIDGIDVCHKLSNRDVLYKCAIEISLDINKPRRSRIRKPSYFAVVSERHRRHPPRAVLRNLLTFAFPAFTFDYKSREKWRKFAGEDLNRAVEVNVL
ncbi:hypothetical protein DICVIV_05546 [Dictyocaulus viviparus]|uniref:Uncharacterized protein n=1 Tax=Dictyocaulus viviparus TaxID=29172 RepID=A0A0D8XV33_DICVI|nr:hypothetical protein DICVIV_05546 [Dictyocaulus viviparus]